MARPSKTAGGKFVSPARSLEELDPTPSETTALLPETGGPGKPQDDSQWVGMADFDHLPWWRRPSVSCRTLRPNAPEAVSNVGPTRSFGCLAHTRSSPLRLEALLSPS